MPEKERYLGDGVYATFDGYHIELKTTRVVDGQEVEHFIYIEPNVFAVLDDFARTVWHYDD